MAVHSSRVDHGQRLGLFADLAACHSIIEQANAISNAHMNKTIRVVTSIPTEARAGPRLVSGSASHGERERGSGFA